MPNPCPASALAFALSCLASVSTASGQSQLLNVNGTAAGDMFGAALAVLPDVDGDGSSDLAVGATGTFTLFAPAGAETVTIVSGATGAVLTSFGVAGVAFGSSLAAFDDVDGDGIGDIAVGARVGRFVDLRSTVTGALIRRILAPAGVAGAFGSSIATLGDIDGDGTSDLVVGAPELTSTPNTEWAGVVSGATGALVYAITDASPGGPFTPMLGIDVTGPGDLDGDAVPDVVISDSGNQFNQAGRVVVYSGATGALVRVHLDPFPPPFTVVSYGRSLASCGDVNGDSVPDYAIATPNALLVSNNYGAVDMHSGATGALLWRTAPTSGESYGVDVARVADVNCDGVDDVATIAKHVFSSGSAFSAVLSGRTGSIIMKSAPYSFTSALGAIAGGGDLNGDGFADIAAGIIASIGSSPGTVIAHTGWDGPVASSGSGCAGSGGFTPELIVRSCGTATHPFMLGVKKALGGSFGVLLYGTSFGSTPAPGGCLLNLANPLPPTIVLPLFGAGAGQGSVAVTGVVPPGLPSVDVVHQLFVADPGVPRGYSTTKAVKLTLD